MERIDNNKTSVNYREFSFEEVKRLAEQGDAKAQFDLAMRYMYGSEEDANTQFFFGSKHTILIAEGMERTREQAVEWFKKAAEQGLAEAQHFLGNCYSGGFGVEVNYEEAIKWW